MGNACTSRFDDSFDELRLSYRSIEEKNSQLPQSMKINILSYNIFIRPPFVSNNGNDFKDERLAEFLKHVGPFDVICLQEMFAAYSGRRSNLLKQAKEAGFLYYTASPKPDTFSVHMIDGGLLMLSRFPIVASEYRPFSCGIGSDYYVNKGILYAKIAIGSSRVHLFTTHAQATYDDTLKYFATRAEQFNTFRKFIKETLAAHSYEENDVVLLTGDFNVNSRSNKKYQPEVLDSIPVLQVLESLKQKAEFDEYDALVSCLSGDHKDQLENLIHKKFGEHPITFGDYVVNGDNVKTPIETLLTHPECMCADESLDYIFKYTPKKLKRKFSNLVQEIRPKAKAELTLVEEDTTVEKFSVKGHAFAQLSDHYGVKVTLQYSKMPELEKEDSETTASVNSIVAPYESPNKSIKSSY